jgi:hypothetical protein
MQLLLVVLLVHQQLPLQLRASHCRLGLPPCLSPWLAASTKAGLVVLMLLLTLQVQPVGRRLAGRAAGTAAGVTLLFQLLLLQLGWCSQRYQGSSSSLGLPLTAAHAQHAVGVRVAAVSSNTCEEARPLMPRVLPLLHPHQQGLRGGVGGAMKSWMVLNGMVSSARPRRVGLTLLAHPALPAALLLLMVQAWPCLPAIQPQQQELVMVVHLAVSAAAAVLQAVLLLLLLRQGSWAVSYPSMTWAMVGV